MIRVLLLAVLLQGTAQTASDPEVERKTRSIAATIKCIVCQGLSIEDSPSDLAQEMRAVVYDQVAAGKTEKEVQAYFVERYGEQILLLPPARGLNSLVYILPVVLILGGGVFVYYQARAWTQPAGESE